MADNFLRRYEKAFRYSMNTYPIGDSPLEISAARRSFAPLQNRAEITVLMCEQKRPIRHRFRPGANAIRHSTCEKSFSEKH